MNKTRLIFVLALILAATIPPGQSVQADYSISTEPVPMMEDDPGDWHCYSATPGPCPADSDGPFGYEGVKNDSIEFTMLRGKIVCTGWGCSKIDVYVEIDWAVEWSSTYNRTAVSVTLTAWGWNTSVDNDFTTPCGTGYSGSCSGHYYILMPSTQISSDPSADYHVSSHIKINNTGTGDTRTTTFSVYYSGTPIDIDNCDENYQATECSIEDIDPTSEAGITGSMVEGELYRFEVGGGPWYSEAEGAERYDLQFSFDDGSTWLTLAELMSMAEIECIQNDPDGNTELFVIYFLAPSDSLTVRVADTAGQFADNTGSMVATLCAAVEVGGSASACDGQFTVGTTVVLTGTIAANTAYVQTEVSGNENWVEAGEWYALTTSGGPWLDSGSPPDRYDIQMKDSLSDLWQDTDDYSNSNCQVEGGNYVTVYFQGSATLQLYLRVADDGEVFSSNTGSMDYTITMVDEYDPYPTGCAISYDRNNFLEHREVLGTNGLGIELMATTNFQWPVFPFISGGELDFPKMVRYLVLETTGQWYDDGVLSTEGDMKQDDDSWQEISIWDQANCVEVIDPIGHVRVYFDALQDRTWKFRVHDEVSLNGFIDNSGKLGYDLYYGINYQIPNTTGVDIPEAGACTDFYSYDETGGIEITLNGSNANGLLLPLITANEVIAVKVIDGPWLNSGVASYQVGISDDNGSTYTNLAEYDGNVCSEQAPDSDHPLFYLYGREGKTYRVRVYDPGMVFTDNSDSISLMVYPATADDKVNSWQSCATNYDLVEVPLSTEERFISAALDAGTAIPSITAGVNYALEITGESNTIIHDVLLGQYAAEVSKDGGQTWEDFPLATWATCVVALTYNEDPEYSRYRIYFTAENGATYRIRTDSEHPSDGGLYFKLYKTAVHSSPTTPGYNPVIPFTPSSWGGCNMVCMRPGGLFSTSSFSLGSISFGDLGDVVFPSVALPLPNVGGWLDYGRCSIITYLSWCDEHTAALVQVFALLNEREPFGSIQEVMDGYAILRDGIEAITSEGGEAEQYNLAPDSMIFGGASGGENFQGIIPNLEDTNPLFGGSFDLTGESSAIEGGESDEAMAYYDTNCHEAMEPKIGNAADGFCWYMGLLHKYPWGIYILTAIQVLFDLIALLSFIRYIMDKWIGKGVPA